RDDEHLAARRALVTLHHPEMGEERHSGNAVRLSRTPLAMPRPAPLLGEHSREVLARWLGVDERAVAELVVDGVCCWTRRRGRGAVSVSTDLTWSHEKQLI